MEHLPEDKKVVDLLTKLKDSNGNYPSEMLAARRQAYLRQVANVGLGLGIGEGLKHIAKGGGNVTGTVASVTSKVLETVLITAITIEAGTAAYLYRDKIANAVRSYLGSPTVQAVASPATEISSSGSELITPSVVPSTTPSGTPSPELAEVATNGNTHNNNNGGSVEVNATPSPGGNNGNQFGLTPKPVRTTDGNSNNSGNNNNNGGGGNNNGNGGNTNNKP